MKQYLLLELAFLISFFQEEKNEAKEDHGAAPYRLVENNLALLDLTELVFIDPIRTGFSKVE